MLLRIRYNQNLQAMTTYICQLLMKALKAYALTTTVVSVLVSCFTYPYVMYEHILIGILILWLQFMFFEPLCPKEDRAHVQGLTDQQIAQGEWSRFSALYNGRRQAVHTLDNRLGDMDVLMDLRPSRYAKRRRNAKRREEQFYLHKLGQPNPRVQSDESIQIDLSGLASALENVKMGDYVLKLTEDVAMMAYHLTRAQNRVDIGMAITNFAKLRIDTSLTSATFGKLLQIRFSELFKEEEVQSLDTDMFMPLQNLLDNYKNVKESPLYKKLYRFLMYALSLSLFDSIGVSFDSLGYTAMERECLKAKYTSGPDFVHCVLDTALFFCRRGYQCYQSGTMEPMFHSGSSYEKWYDEARAIKLMHTCLANPEAHNFTYFEFMQRLENALEQGDAIVRNLRMSLSPDCKYDRNFVQKYVDDLRLIRATEVTKKAARECRPAPFSILVYGGSSVGKSTFKDILFAHYGKVFGLPIDSSYMYTRVFTDEYWSGFSTSQWCIVMDDIGFRKAGYAQGDKSLDEMLQIINNVAFTTPQADLPDKGKIPVKSKLVIGTTNAEHLNAYAYFHNALAIQRRMPYVVEICPKPEYTRDNVFLDSNCVPQDTQSYPDLWHIVVKRVVPQGTSISDQNAKLEIIQEFDDIDLFLGWYSRTAREHEEIQRNVVNTTNSMQHIKICDRCFMSCSKCSCVTTCGEIPVVQTFDISQFNGTVDVALREMEAGLPNHQNPWGNCFTLWYIVAVHCTMIFLALRKYHWTRIFMSYVFSSSTLTWIVCFLARYTGARFHREFTRVFGEMTEFRLAVPRRLGQIAAALSTLIGLYASYKFGKSLLSSLAPSKGKEEDIKVQGNNMSTDRASEKYGVIPVSDGTQREQVWYKNDFVLSHEDVNPLTLGWKTMEPTEVYSRLLSNCCTFISRKEVDGKIICRTNRAICVGGQVYMTNSHGLFDDVESFELEAIFSSSKDGVTPNLRMRIQNSQIFRYPHRDLAFVELRNLPPCKNIVDLFSTEVVAGRYKGFYCAIDENGAARKFELYVQEKRDIYQSSTEKHTFDRTFPMWKAVSNRNSDYGDCGSLLVGFTGRGPVALGLHFRGGFDCVVEAIAVTRDDIQQAIRKFGAPLIQNGPPEISAPGKPRLVTGLHPKSCIRFLEKGTARVYGSFVGMRPRHKSRVGKTYICDAMLKRGYTIKTSAPVMGGWVPWHLAIKEMVLPTCNIDEVLLDDCVSAFSRDILANLPATELQRLVVLSNDAAVNGVPGVTYLDKMNRNTSMGNPWKTRKVNYLRAMEDQTVWQDGVVFDDAILDRVDSIIARYEQGIRFKPVFCGHLKDEALPQRKVSAGKTRVFTGGPADWSIVVRKFLLTFVQVLQRNRFVFEAGPGTICQSLEWEEIFEYLTQHGPDRIVAGDYGKFDKRMTASFIIAAYEVIINVLRAAGWTDRELLIVRCIAMDTAFPLVEFNGDLVEFYGTNPSGHPLTVIINCIVNSLYLRYCYGKLSPQHEVDSFKDNVALMTYGDDNAFGVSRCCDWFNHTAISQELAKIGVEYTMPDKESESVPFVHINDIQFLKRTWRWDDEVGAYLCPLDHDSIEKMLTMCVRSDDDCAEAQSIDIIESALSEYFYYGRETYDEKRKMLMEVAQETGIMPFVSSSTFRSWEHLRQRFWDSSAHVKLGKFVTEFSPERRIPSRRGSFSKPNEDSTDSDCFSDSDDIAERMGQWEDTPERSSKSVFTEVVGLSTYSSKEEVGYGESISGINSPAKHSIQESEDYKTETTPVVQSDEFEEILSLSDQAIGRLVRRTWRPDQYVKYKRFLLRELRATRTLLSVLSPVEQEAMIHELERQLEASGHRNHVVFRGDSEEPQVQSGETEEGSTSAVQNIVFADGKCIAPEVLPSLLDSTYDVGVDTTANLARYLERPVDIYTLTWTEGSTTKFQGSFKPWTLFFQYSSIASKLANFSRIRCTMRLKFVLNASPFYYGCLRAAYTPYGGVDYITEDNDQVIYSQRPGVYLEPQKMTEAELTLPFLTPQNFINTRAAANFDEMGKIDYVLYSKLRSANGVTGNNITVTCYAWAENVVLSGPSKAPVVQSDEYEEDATVSGAASAVANVAGALVDVPVIGNMARATQQGATMFAGLARLFGFSNPPNISDVAGVQPKAFHAMANVDTKVPHDKLALDAKNEVTISNTVTGISGEDPLALANIIHRESFVFGSLWDGSNAKDTLLASWLVTPAPVITATVSGNTALWYTPLSYTAAMFSLWRGSIHYKIKIIKTKYHRGRLLISWDPSFDITTTSDTETTCFSRIVDLEHDDEIDLVIPYKATTPWLSTDTYSSAYSNGSAPTYNLDLTRCNGVVTVRVLNVLTGPTTAPQLDLLIYTQAGDDFAFAVPQQLPTNHSPFIQSKDEVEVMSRESVPVDKFVNAITVGESVASLRPLLHRLSLSCVQEVGSSLASAGTYQGSGAILNCNILPKYPKPYGKDPNGFNLATVSAATVRFNYNNVHPLDWVLNCFAGFRGSTVLQVNPICESSNTTLASSVSIDRQQGTFVLNPTQQNLNRFSVVATNAPSTLSRTVASTTNSVSRWPSGERGMSLTNQRTQAGVSVVIPQYSRARFRKAHASVRDSSADLDLVRVDSVFRQNAAGSASTPWPFYAIYYAAGVDFNPVFFISTPRMYASTLPNAVDTFT